MRPASAGCTTASPSTTSGLPAVGRQGARRDFSPSRITYARDAPGLLRPQGPVGRHERATASSASLCFPSFPRFCGQLFYEADDRELALLCVQAYNDWMIDEWCGPRPAATSRSTIMPLWDPAARGRGDRAHRGKGRAVSLLGEPGAARAADHPRPVTVLGPVHGGVCGHRHGRLHARRLVVERFRTISPDSPLIGRSRWAPTADVRARCIDWLFSGLFYAVPEDQDRLVRGRDRLDPVLPRARARRCSTSSRALGRAGDVELDSSCRPGRRTAKAASTRGFDMPRARSATTSTAASSTTSTGPRTSTRSARQRDDRDRLPARDSTWPNSWQMAKDVLEGKDDEVIYKILQGNARKVFHNFEYADEPVLALT